MNIESAASSNVAQSWNSPPNMHLLLLPAESIIQLANQIHSRSAKIGQPEGVLKRIVSGPIAL